MPPWIVHGQSDLHGIMGDVGESVMMSDVVGG